MESPTATELPLPGLEARVVTDPSPQHFIERGPLKRLMVFAGRSHPELTARIAESLGVEPGEVTLKTFANDETYCRYDESIRGADIFIVQTGCPPVDKNLMELLLLIQAAKLASAKRITAVIPWFPYSRQDRKAKPREPISARLVADMLQLAGVDRVLTMDLHAGQIQGFFTIPVDHMTSLPLFARHFRDLGLHGVRRLVVINGHFENTWPIVEGIDLGVEEAGDDGRGFVFDDDGGTRDKGAGQEVAALVDRDLDEFAGFKIEDEADAHGLG